MIEKRLFQHHTDEFKPNVGLKVLEALGSPILLTDLEAQGGVKVSPSIFKNLWPKW